nr:MAG TPA: ATP synthase subunit [Caudoviricetes sp.]
MTSPIWIGCIIIGICWCAAILYYIIAIVLGLPLVILSKIYNRMKR